MRKEALTFQDVYQFADTVMISGAQMEKFGQGPFKVKRDNGATVTVTILLEAEIPKENIALHENRPSWMEPEYEKCG